MTEGMKITRILGALLLTLAIGACATPPKVKLPAPLEPARSEPRPQAEQVLLEQQARPDGLRQSPTPTAPARTFGRRRAAGQKRLPVSGTGTAATASPDGRSCP